MGDFTNKTQGRQTWEALAAAAKETNQLSVTENKKMVSGWMEHGFAKMSDTADKPPMTQMKEQMQRALTILEAHRKSLPVEKQQTFYKDQLDVFLQQNPAKRELADYVESCVSYKDQTLLTVLMNKGNPNSSLADIIEVASKVSKKAMQP